MFVSIFNINFNVTHWTLLVYLYRLIIFNKLKIILKDLLRLHSIYLYPYISCRYKVLSKNNYILKSYLLRHAGHRLNIFHSPYDNAPILNLGVYSIFIQFSFR